MKRISIDVTDTERQPNTDKATTPSELENLLDNRLENAYAGGVSSCTVRDIIEQVIGEVSS